MRPKIEINNLNKRYKLDTLYIKKIIVKISALLKKPHDMELEVIFLNDVQMRALNKRYKKRNRSTDVLAFNIDLKEFGSRARLGEIFISSDEAFKNAKAFGTRFDKELVLYLIHALLHLSGYRDEKRGDKLRMHKREKGILNYLWETEDLSKVLMPR
ncbi:MAG: rRNA maturation RNase YbeY [Candidatus Omnitrophica bacterium]|nr:rRNA maturation RNase YbeY [Candidatus Omnitrophota bacterium]